MGQPSPIDETLRLEILQRYEILDSAPEQAFDNITSLAAEICATPIALISLVDEARQWFKARVGLQQSEIPRELAFCAHALDSPRALIVPDARRDPRFAENALVTGDPNIRFYAGIPLVSREGAVLGTLCVIDREERALEARHLRALQRLARQVEGELELRRRLTELSALADPDKRHAHSERFLERSSESVMVRTDRGKDLLVHLLVHDLKSPLMSLSLNATLLGQAPWADSRTREVAREIEIAAESIQRVIVSVLDIGRAQHGVLSVRRTKLDVHGLIEEVVLAMGLKAALKGQTIFAERHGAAPASLVLSADRDLLRRVLENLIDNCLKYSPLNSSVHVSAGLTPTSVEICVSDEGAGVPESDRIRIFEPFTRLDSGKRESPFGHGLGLAFCKVAVEAHGGRVWVAPNQPRGARFFVELPLQPRS